MYFSLSYLEDIKLPRYVDECSSNLGSFFIISPHILSAPFFFLSPGISIMYMLVHLMVSYRSLRLCSFSTYLFFFLYLQAHWLFLLPNLFLNLSSEIFISVIMLFNSKFSIWVFWFFKIHFTIFIFLLIILYLIDIVHILSFSTLDMFSFHSLNIFKII